jgi:hypothetical protein
LIVRDAPGGGLLTVSQPEHAALCGLFASRWGAPPFTRPEPHPSLVRAATYHDHGWITYEAAPRCDPQSGRPYTHRGMPFDPRQLVTHRWAVEWMTAIDPHAGVLCSMHRTGLPQSRYGVVESPPQRGGRTMAEQERAFVEELERAREPLVESLGRERLDLDYRLLQLWDLLSLYLCLSEPQAEVIAVVPAPSGAGGVRLDLQPLGDGRIRVTPFPFDQDPLVVAVPCRWLVRERFDSDADFQAALAASPLRPVEYRFVA